MKSLLFFIANSSHSLTSIFSRTTAIACELQTPVLDVNHNAFAPGLGCALSKFYRVQSYRVQQKRGIGGIGRFRLCKSRYVLGTDERNRWQTQ